MSSDITISSGGAISVDSEAFREIGLRMATVVSRLSQAAEKVGRAQLLLAQTEQTSVRVDLAAIRASAGRLERMATDEERHVTGIRLMADVFELVELRTEQDALRIRDPHQAAAMSLQERIDALIASDPRVEPMAAQLVAAWEKGRLEGLGGQPLDRALVAAGITSGLLPMLQGVILGLSPKSPSGRGALSPGARLSGPPPPVAVEQTSRTVVADTPRTLTQTLQRIPKGEAQIRVEKMTYRDGTESYMTYIDGTRPALPGTDEAWDMGSNWDMYMEGERSASSEATRRALELAGAKPGDRVDFVAYSQGGMIGDYAAMEGYYDTKLVVSVGSPTQPVLNSDQMLVELRHTDDPVGSGLSGGGVAGGTGSPDSFSITREAADGLLETSLDAHFLDKYIETSQLAEASGDPRVKVFDEKLSLLDEAVKVERMEFVATRE